MNSDYKSLKEFWNQNFILKEEDKKEILNSINKDEDYKDLAPSKKQYEILSLFEDKKKVLDYGSGSGWASIIMAKYNVKKVVSVDVSENSIELLKTYSKAFDTESLIEPIVIDENWLKTIRDESFDGFFSSNVVDVIPLEMAKEIIKESSRIVNKDAVVIYSFNYYIDPKEMEKRGCIVNPPYIYINGILRLTSLTDDEWSNIFKEYFDIVDLSYFSWPGEKTETRRIFILKKKAI